jgi:hypothetical protein
MYCGVRAGINPAPTEPTTSNGFRSGDNSPQFCVKGDNVGAGFIPALTPKFSVKGDNVVRAGFIPALTL